MSGSLRLGAWKGQPSVTLVAGDRDATFLPGCGMLCASLRHRGDEYVAWPRTLAQFREGSMTAVPFVHPWGNRLERRGYRVGRKDVDLRGIDLPTDPNGLPMHGNLRGAAVRRRAGRGRRGERAPRRPARLRRATRSPARLPVSSRRHDRSPARRPRVAASPPVSSRPAGRRCRSRSAGTRTCKCPAHRAASGSCAGRSVNACSSTNA